MISVIVPIYKAEKYLRRCIDSILAQTYTDFELLLIDDGSPDRSGEICDEYAKQDSRVRVFHKPNGGVSSARNLGLDNAKGEWITFVDADDWVELNYLDNLLLSDNADMVIGGVCCCSSGRLLEFDDKIYSGNALLNFINRNKGYKANPPWGNLLRSSLIKDKNIRFDEVIRFGEDAVFNLQYLCHCKLVCTTSNCDYNYWDYDISANASQKYCLSIDEVEYTLRKLTNLNSQIGRILGGEVSSSADNAMMLGMVSFEDRCDEQKGENFYRMCMTLGIVKNRTEYYNNELCSPVFQGIALLKAKYEIKDYENANSIYRLLAKYCKSTGSILFRLKDFYLWYYLIKYRHASSLFFLLKFYFKLKRLLQ